MIFLIFVQYTKHRMQIMQECSEYDFMTNYVNFMQQMTSSLSEGDIIVFLTNTYCSPPTWKIPRKSMQVLKTSVSGTNTSAEAFDTIHHNILITHLSSWFGIHALFSTGLSFTYRLAASVLNVLTTSRPFMLPLLVSLSLSSRPSTHHHVHYPSQYPWPPPLCRWHSASPITTYLFHKSYPP